MYERNGFGLLVWLVERLVHLVVLVVAVPVLLVLWWEYGNEALFQALLVLVAVRILRRAARQGLDR